MKNTVCAALGVLGGLISASFGGWDASLNTLVFFMGLDYLTGLVVAGVFRRSDKSENGALESRAGWKGLLRKGMTLAVVFVACRLDMLLGTSFVRDATVIAFVVNETLSIVENAGLMGVPFPPAVADSLETLKRKAGMSDGKEGAHE
ncbi:MAG: phage holin family protein [Oscillibacter sp.]|nr:phage holin family protein [Oscillibacter sp.]